MARRTLGFTSLVPARIATDAVYLTQLANYMLALAASMEVRPVEAPQITEALSSIRLPAGTKMLRATLLVEDFDVEVPAEAPQLVEDDPGIFDTPTGPVLGTGDVPLRREVPADEATDLHRLGAEAAMYGHLAAADDAATAGDQAGWARSTADALDAAMATLPPDPVAMEIRRQKTTCTEPGHEYLPRPSCWTCGRNGAFERAARIAEGTVDPSRPECEPAETPVEDGLGRTAYEARCMHGRWRNLLGPGKAVGRAERWHEAVETGNTPRSGDGPDEEPETDGGPPTYQDLQQDLTRTERNRAHYQGLWERAEEELRDLRARLKLAERVCQFYGEAPDGGATPLRDKALRRAWQDWHDEYKDVVRPLDGMDLDDVIRRSEATAATPGRAS